MPRAEVGTPKYLANKMKSKGLQRLRWFCQVCSKQCRDENGFKCHTQSEAHLRQMLVVGENASRHISDFSSTFQSEFVALLSRRFGTKRVLANRVYQEYIADKSHLHMNATRWVTLTEFCKHLGRTGVGRVDETEKGWFIAWIDNSPKALAKAEASMKKERATTSDEQRERLLIAEQIERAKAEAEADAGPSSSSSSSPNTPPAEGLQREEGTNKVVLSFSISKPPPNEPAHTPTAAAPAPAPLKFNAFKASKPSTSVPLKTNVFKTGSKRPFSAAEELILEEQERKKRRKEREGISV